MAATPGIRYSYGRPLNTATPRLNMASQFYKGCRVFFCLNGQHFNSVSRTGFSTISLGVPAYMPASQGIEVNSLAPRGVAWNGGVLATQRRVTTLGLATAQPGSFTLVARAFPRTLTGGTGTICAFGGGNNNQCSIGFSAATTFNFGAGDTTDTLASLPTGFFRWLDIVAVYEQGARKLFWINARPYLMTTRSGATALSNIFSIGGGSDAANGFDGLIADVGFWTYAWPDELVRSWYDPQLRNQFFAPRQKVLLMEPPVASGFLSRLSLMGAG